MIVSHNTFTYLRPKDWWGWFTLPFTRCQKRNIKDQGLDIADLRLRYTNGEWWVCHGQTRFCKLPEGLKILRDSGIKETRILLEPQPDLSMIDYFHLETTLKDGYGDFKFWEGRRKDDWRKLLDFPDFPDLYQYVGSMSGGWLGKTCPWIWWHLVGKKNQGVWKEKSKTLNVALDFL